MSDSLNTFVDSICKESHLRVENDFGDGFVRLKIDEAQRRQAEQDIRCSEDVLIELLRNSRDAHARVLFVALNKIGSVRRITIIDDGEGVPHKMHELIFEPRVTSKLDSSHIDKWGVHGRGMALYSIKTNTQEAYVATSEKGLGCAIVVQSDTEKLKEKADQSSFPNFDFESNNTVKIKGPKNLIRCACEFAIEHRNTLLVYVGSPVEIATTLYSFGISSVSKIDRIFQSDLSEIPLCKRLAFAPDEQSFAQIASDLGLPISSRTARRIMDGELKAQDSLIDIIQNHLIVKSTNKGSNATKKRTASKRGKIYLAEDDLREFKDGVSQSFSSLAKSYYLENDVDVKVQTKPDKIVVEIPLIQHE